MSYASQAHFNNYDPSSFGWSRNVDLVPLTFDGVNFGQCARAAHPVLTAVLAELVPLIPGGLKAGSCWAYSTTDDLAGGTWSFHHYGIAMDVNWNVNKMGVPNAAKGQYAIPHAAASAIARKYGCEYGGDWTAPKDWMHFEVHLPPSVARAVVPTHPTPTPPDFLEQIMALDRNSADYKNLVADIVHGVLNAPIKSTANGHSYPLHQYLTTLDARTADLEKKVK